MGNIQMEKKSPVTQQYHIQENKYWEEYFRLNNPLNNDYNPFVEKLPIPPIENFAFKGGGVKVTGTIGAIKHFEEQHPDILRNLKRIGGSSGGAIIGSMLALGFTSKEIEKELHFGKFKDIGKDHWWDPLDIFKNIKAGFRLFGIAKKEKFGFSSGDAFYDWIRELIAKKLGNPNATFRDLIKARKKDPNTFKELYITGVDVDNDDDKVSSLKYFSHEKYPDMPIGLAVRISMSFPGGFTPVEWNDKKWIDGGAINNYPMEMFNKMKFIHPDFKHYGFTDVAGNFSTLGFVPVSIEDKKAKKGLLAKIANCYPMKILNAVLFDDQKKVEEQYYANTIEYETKLGILQEKVSKKDRQKAIQDGYNAAKEHMKNYRDPNNYYKHIKHKNFDEKYENSIPRKNAKKIKLFLESILIKNPNLPKEKMDSIKEEIQTIDNKFNLHNISIKQKKIQSYNINSVKKQKQELPIIAQELPVIQEEKEPEIFAHIENIIQIFKQSTEHFEELKILSNEIINKLEQLKELNSVPIHIINKQLDKIKKEINQFNNDVDQDLKAIKEAQISLKQHNFNEAKKDKIFFYNSICKLDTSLKNYITKHNTFSMKLLEYFTHFLPNSMIPQKLVYIRQAIKLKNESHKIRKDMHKYKVSKNQNIDNWKNINMKSLLDKKVSILNMFSKVKTFMKAKLR